MSDLLNWLLVFLRAGALLAIFPVFSANNIPATIRVALAGLVSFLVAPLVPVTALATVDFWGVLGLMVVEVGVGLLLGFASRMIFYALEVAGGLMATEIGLMIPAGINPLTTSPTSEMSTILQYMGAMLFLTMNLHHGLLLAFQKSYQFLPIGGGHLHESLLLDVVGAHQPSFPVRGADVGARARRDIRHHVDLCRAGPRGAADECLLRKLFGAVAGRDDRLRPHLPAHGPAHRQLSPAAPGGRVARGPTDGGEMKCQMTNSEGRTQAALPAGIRHSSFATRNSPHG